jgi:hypothetical protein
MVMQYPDIVSFQNSTDAVYDENTGKWTPGTGSTVTSQCRYEASNGNGVINTDGGERINYSGIVYLPKDAPVIKTGTEVTVTVKRDGQGDQVVKDKVLRFFRGQMNARLWV